MKRIKFNPTKTKRKVEPMHYNCSQFMQRTALSKSEFEYRRRLLDPNPKKKKFFDSDVLAYLFMHDLIYWGGMPVEDLRRLDWKFIFTACNSNGIGNFKFVYDKVEGEIFFLEKDSPVPGGRREVQILTIKMSELQALISESKNQDYVDGSGNMHDLDLYRNVGQLSVSAD